MGMPPAEEREASAQAMGLDDLFGCGMRPQQMLHLQEMEAAQQDKLIVILSDVQLDKPLVSIDCSVYYGLLVLYYMYSLW